MANRLTQSDATRIVSMDDANLLRIARQTLNLLDPTGSVTAMLVDSGWRVNMSTRTLFCSRTFGARLLTDAEFRYLCVHEAGHLLWSTGTQIPNVAHPDDWRMIWNACEDMRSERCSAERYPGFRRMLTDVGLPTLRESYFANFDSMDHVRAAWMDAMHRFYTDSFDSPYGIGVPSHFTEACENTRDLFKRASQCATMADMMPYVQRIYDALYPPVNSDDDKGSDDTGADDTSQDDTAQSEDGTSDESQSDDTSQDESPSDDGTQTDDGTSGDESDDDTDDASDDDTSSGGSDDTSDDETDDDTDTDGDTDGDSADSGEATSDDPSSDTSGDGTSDDTSTDDTSDDTDTDTGNTPDTDTSPDTSPVVDPSNVYESVSETAQTDPTQHMRDMSDAYGGWTNAIDRTSSGAMGAIMRTMLRQNDIAAKRRGMTSGRLDRKRMRKAAAGDLHVFTRKREPGAPKYHLIISVDTSASMGSRMAGGRMTRADVALRAAATLSEAWRETKQPFTVFGWGGKVNYVVTDKSRPYELDTAHRVRMDEGRTRENVAAQYAWTVIVRAAAKGYIPIWLHITDGGTAIVRQDIIDNFVATYGKGHIYWIGIDRGHTVADWPNTVTITRSDDLLPYMRDVIRRQVASERIRSY